MSKQNLSLELIFLPKPHMELLTFLGPQHTHPHFALLLICICLVDSGSCYVAQAGLEILGSMALLPQLPAVRRLQVSNNTPALTAFLYFFFPVLGIEPHAWQACILSQSHTPGFKSI